MPADSIRTDAAPVEIRLADYTPPAFLIDTVDLIFELDEKATTVVSKLSVRRNPTAPDDSPLHLDGEALTLVGITCNGAPVTPVETKDGLTITDIPAIALLEISTSTSPITNTELSGLYVSGGNYYTQCEAQGFRRITYYPDRPDVMAVFTTRIEADKAEAPVLLANGNLRESGELSGGRLGVGHGGAPIAALRAEVAASPAKNRSRIYSLPPIHAAGCLC